MPFTPAHSILALGLKKRGPRYLSLTGLIVGAMIPDFTYFFPLPGLGPHYLHSLKGALLIALPLGLAVSLFVWWVREPAVELLGFRERFALRPIAREPLDLRVRAILLLFGSVFVGEVSHIFWDSLTHRHGWFVERFPVMQHAMWWPDSSVYNSLQHLSDAVGLGILLFLWINWRRGQRIGEAELRTLRRERAPIALYWTLIFTMALLVSIGFIDRKELLTIDLINWEAVMLPIVVHFGATFLATLALSLVVLRLSGKRTEAK